MTLSRRELITGGASMAGTAALLRPSSANADHAPPRHVVIVVLRGGADGFSLVVPYVEPRYYAARPSLAVPPPGRGNGAVKLDARHGLHPRLAPLESWFYTGELGIVVGAGWPVRIRSHRLAERALDAAVTDALGGVPVPLRAPPRSALLDVARRLREGRAPAACVVESGGWDTHVAQDGRLGEKLGELAGALSAFRTAAGEHWHDVLVIVLSEFGRALDETMVGGTRDGNPQTLLVLDGRRRLGKVMGRLPDLAPAALEGDRCPRPTAALDGVLRQLLRTEASP